MSEVKLIPGGVKSVEYSAPNEWLFDHVNMLMDELRRTERLLFWYRVAFGLTLGAALVMRFT